MITEIDHLADGASLAADLCIVGAGAAGLMIAREFLGTSTQVVLLESGDALGLRRVAANPTLTLVAIALRLAERPQDELARQMAGARPDAAAVLARAAGT